MAFLDTVRKWVGRNRDARYMQMLSGQLPVYTQFGQNVYASDIVQECIDVIATEMSKLQPRHIRIDANDVQSTPNGNINRILKFGPNPLMNMSEFLEKTTWLLYLNDNAFIVPIYDIELTNGVERRIYRALYPINPSRVEFLSDLSDTLLIRFHFGSGTNATFRYSDIIHLRRKFSVNDLMGGGANGQPDNSALLKALQMNHSVMQGLDKAVKVSTAVQAIVKINTMMDDAALQAERKRFEKLIASGESGILPVDLKGDYTVVDKSAIRFVDKDTLQFLQSTVLHWYSVPLPILTGEFDDNNYQAFYEKTLEPMVIRWGQSFSRGLFTNRELDVGNQTVFYHRNMQYMSMKIKLELIKISGEQGLVDLDEKRRILGYAPLGGEEGRLRTMSLNHIDVNLINQYQMKSAQDVKKKGGKSGDGTGKENDE